MQKNWLGRAAGIVIANWRYVAWKAR